MQSVASVSDLLRTLTDRLTSTSSQLVFGPPHQGDGKTIIPVAEVRYGFGLGLGGGSGTQPGQPAEEAPSGTGAGGGGGGTARARPVGFIEITGQEADFVPIIDYTTIIRTLLVVIAVVCVAVAGMTRREG